MPDVQPLRPEQYLSDKQVAALLGVSRPTIWRWTKTYPAFPKPIELTPGTTRWLLSELEAYIADLKLARRVAK